MSELKQILHYNNTYFLPVVCAVYLTFHTPTNIMILLTDRLQFTIINLAGSNAVSTNF
jgi:hypothetical protein